MNSRHFLPIAAFFFTLSPMAGALPCIDALAVDELKVLQQNDTHAKPSLLAATTALSRGTPNLLAISFKIDEHWHLYADAQNDTGQAPTLKLDLPAGVTATPLRFPPAKRLIQGDSVLDHIYEDKLVLLFQINIAESFKSPDLAINGSLEWLECADVCKFGKGSVSLTLPVVGRDVKPSPSSHAKTIAEALKALPLTTLPAKATVELFPVDQPTNAKITVPGAKRLFFTPDNSSVFVNNLIESGTVEHETLAFSFEPDKSKSVLSGVLEVRNATESRWYHISKPLTPANSPGPKSVPGPTPVPTPAAR